VQERLDLLCNAFVDLWELKELGCLKAYPSLEKVERDLMMWRERCLKAEAEGEVVFVERPLTKWIEWR
jgi:hypothetical protein